MAKLPPPGGATPTSVAFAPDGRAVTFLLSEQGSLTRKLYALDVVTGAPRSLVEPAGGGDTEENLTLEERLQRERRRDLGVGVTQYAWAKEAPRMVIPLKGSLFVLDGLDGDLHEVVSKGEHPALDARLSPDGMRLAFVRDAEVYVVDLDERGRAVGEARQVTGGARGTGRTHGLAEFVAQEEMDRSEGYWWSRDGRHLAFAEVDETHIPVYRIVHQGSDSTGDDAYEDHRYPFAGRPNARVRLGVVPARGGDATWLDLGIDGADDGYLARVHWSQSGDLFVEVEDRDQLRLDLLAFDVASGARRTVLTEKSDVWINLHNGFRSLSSGGFLWLSERSGFRHLYRYDDAGVLVGQLTAGEWMIDAIADVDEGAGCVFVSGTREGPIERHLYRVPLDPGSPVERITSAPGMHTVVVHAHSERYVDVHSSAGHPPVTTLRSLVDDSLLHRIHEAVDERVVALGLQPPDLTSFATDDGATLHLAVYPPDPAEFGPPPWPTVMWVYGGPHAQLVVDGWSATAAMRAQHLRSRGFLVAVTDNRGSARRGLAFEGAIRHNLGDLEVRDQVAAVRHLVDAGLADGDRVGVYGWSYGGYMALMCLARAPEVFRAGVAGAPVTHWDGYDTHYTERYMGTPEANPDGYERSSVMAHASAIRGHLMIVHGLIDENVHFRHSARLVNALIRHRVRYELLLFPDERHSPRREEDRVFMEEQISDFLVRHLAG